MNLTSKYLILVFFFLLLFIYTKLAGPIPFKITSAISSSNDTFTTTGEGIVSGIPDIATITVGVTSTGSTVKEAQMQLNSKINQVTDGTKALGIESIDIQTQNYNINPNYLSNQRISGFTASSNINIKISDLEKINQVIDKATENGANQVGGINFEVNEDSKLIDEARQKAVEDAKKKAQKIAAITGFNLGKVVSYQENSGEGLISSALPFGGQDSLTQVSPGSKEIKIFVILGFEVY